MRALVVAAVAIAALGIAGSASAGGWATVQLSSTPKGIDAGGTWKVDITVLQHGRTPLAGVTPEVRIRQGKSGKQSVFTAKPTDRAGVYHADVRFPAEGTWSYAVYDGFSEYGGAKVHTFASVSIGPGGGGSAILYWLLGAGAALAAAFMAAAFFSRQRRATVPAAARS